MKKHVLLCLFLLTSWNLFGQENFPTNDVRDAREKAYALTNGTIVIDHQTKIKNGTILIRDGIIENVGASVSVPAGYITIDIKGKYVYPSFIDPYTAYGLPAPDKPAAFSFSSAEVINSKTDGAYNANEAIKAHYNAASEFTLNEKDAAELRKNGFGTVLSFKADGLARGTSTLVTLNNTNANKTMLYDKVAAHYSFSKGSSKQSYPISTMGFIAVLRQTYLDAQWYGSLNPKPFRDLTLDSWIATQRLPQIFDTNSWLEVLRADKVGDEFGVQYIIKGSGDEYHRILEVKKTGASMIIPVNYPDAPDVGNPFENDNIALADMKHWELAPTNASTLEKNNIEFAFTAHGLKSSSEYLANIRKAIEYGLSESAALKAMTYTPARLLRFSDRLGTINKGKIANLVISSESLFSESNEILENWIQGDRHIIKTLSEEDHSGKYDLMASGNTWKLEVSGKPGGHSARIVVNDSTNISVSSSFQDNVVELSYKAEGASGTTRLVGWYTADGFAGEGTDANGSTLSWTAKRTGDITSEDQKKDKKEQAELDLGKLTYPLVGHGLEFLPTQETVLIKNATLWTNEAEGIVENTDILLQDGKIAQIGKNLSNSKARVIDAKGKHVTSGIIDEHSHIAASSINDVATNSGMVRISDVIDPTDGHIYTTLSGGVTALQILHGSANPIGGQSALIKLRWGASPDEMKIKNADGFIKFALGENVKRASNQRSIRFPQTRMGVEQVYVDAFNNALEYKKAWSSYNSLSSKAKAMAIRPRRDLAMDAMVEILDSKRFISCHSYVQSEINMLMKVAESFDFRVNTFTHILEGYKVADKMAEHGVGASTFSDWWGYKWEVRYAIPYNAAIMHNAGVTVAINSDDSEMGRRLNQEAAKSIKYGGMSQEDAWKMVTLNPAKMLHLDNRMGSLKVGKDADVVIWSANPLSIYATVESTFVDGIEYYNAAKDAQMTMDIAKEKARLIEKIKGAKANGAKTAGYSRQRREMFHCDDLTINTNANYHNH